MTNQDPRHNFDITISASSSESRDLNRKDTTDDNGLICKRYAPFKNFTIYNYGSYDIKVFFNQRQGFEDVPAGTIRTFTDENVFFYKLQNRSAAGDATVRVTLDNQETELSLLKELVGRS